MRLFEGSKLRLPEFAIRLTTWTLTVAFGATQGWIHRQSMNADGVSYLDMGDAYFRGDWDTAINAYWSPLYSWLLALYTHLVDPTACSEYPSVQLVNFLIYVGALAAFNLFLYELLRYRESREKAGDEQKYMRWLLFLLGHVVFGWSSVCLIGLHTVSPDMCVAAAVYLASAFLLRIREEPSLLRYAILGAILGVGYLAKAPMFPLAAVYLTVAAMLAGNRRKAFVDSAAALLLFALFAGPFVAALSLSKGRLTFGDSGKLAYVWYVNGVTSRHWQGGEGGTPVHPTRQVLASPAVYEFAAPLDVTYPVWYDSSYWYEGVGVVVEPQQQFSVVLHNLTFYTSLFVFHGLVLALGLILLLVLTRERTAVWRRIASLWFVIVPAGAALVMYSLVYVESRHIAPFVAVILICAAAAFDLPANIKGRSLTAAIMAAVFAFSIGPQLFKCIRDIPAGFVVSATQARYCDTALLVQAAGTMPGEKIASIGYSNPFNARWGRLARVRIVAEIYDENDQFVFWKLDPERQRVVLEAFRAAGAEIAVGTLNAGIEPADGWERLGNSNVVIYRLDR